MPINSNLVIGTIWLACICIHIYIYIFMIVWTQHREKTIVLAFAEGLLFCARLVQSVRDELLLKRLGADDPDLPKALTLGVE